MKIKSIQIKEYKSIRSPQTIEFGKGGIVTFIGKNGSGKTNLLEALNTVFQVNSHERFYGNNSLKYSVTLALSNETVKELEELGFDPNQRLIEVYNDGYKNETRDLKINVIRSHSYAEALKKAALAVKDLAAELSDKIKNFRRTLDEISFERDAYSYEYKAIKESEPFSAYSNYYLYDLEQFARDVDRVIESICRDEDKISINGFDNYSYRSLSIAELPEPNFRLVYRAPNLTELEKRYIKFDSNEAESVIKEFNKRISEHSSDLKPAVRKLNQEINKFNALVKNAHDQDEENYLVTKRKGEKKDNFLTRVRKALDKKCYYIPATEQLFAEKHRYTYYDYDSYDYDLLLTETYIKLKYKGEKRNQILSEFEKAHSIDKVLKNLEIDEKEFAADFEEKLNKSLPEFERDMISGIKVQYDNRGLELIIVEKNGTETSFSKTSSGRKWYFAYYFIKNCLKPDDILILDEPGIFLHPQAQTELLHDLERLAGSNLIMLCTHSPYMISGKFNKIYSVNMSSEGTTVSHVDKEDFYNVANEVGFLSDLAVNDLILNSQKELIVCEGDRDIACLTAFMDYFHIEKSNYNFMRVRGYNNAIPLIEFYLKIESNLGKHLKVRVLLDKDAEAEVLKKEISVPTEINKSGRALIGEIPKKNLALLFVGAEDGNGRPDIEGLFSEEDVERFLEPEQNNKKVNKVRIDIGDILSQRDCSEETKRNFKKLFKELDIR